MQDSLRITQITTGLNFNTTVLSPLLWMLSSVFVPICLVLTEPLGDHGGLAVCHVKIGNEDSVVFDLGCSCPFLPETEGAEACLLGLSEIAVYTLEEHCSVGLLDSSLARLVFTLGSASPLHLGPWSPCYSFHLQSQPFLPSN